MSWFGCGQHEGLKFHNRKTMNLESFVGFVDNN